MIKKERKTKTIKIDQIDGFDDFDDFDFDKEFGNLDAPESEFGPNNRSPVVKTGRLLGNVAKNSLTSPFFIQSVIDKNFPKEIKHTIEGLDTTISGVKGVYEQAAKNIKPGLQTAAKTLRSIVAEDSRLFPKWLNNKLSEFAQEESKLASEEQRREDYINANLSELINQTQKTTAQQLTFTSLENEKDRAVNTERFEIGHSVQTQIRDSIANIDAYNRQFQTTFAKKQLEVSYRSLFVLQDILGTQKEATKATVQQLLSIAKNTALPDFVKYQGMEMVKETLKRDLASKTVEPIARNASDITKKLFSNIGKVVGDKARDLSDNIMSGVDLAAMMKDLRDTDREGFNEELKAGVLGLLLEGQIQKAARAGIIKGVDAFESSRFYNPVMKGATRASAVFRNAPYAAQNFINDPEYISALQQGAEDKAEKRKQLLNNVKEYDTGNRAFLSKEEIEAVKAYKKQNFFKRNLKNIQISAKAKALNFADEYSSELTEGILDNRSNINYTDSGVTGQEQDIFTQKKRVDEAITYVIPQYLSHLLREVSAIRSVTVSDKDYRRTDFAVYDPDSRELSNAKNISSKIEKAAYSPDKINNLRQSLDEIVASDKENNLSEQSKESLFSTILNYWQSSKSKKMGSSIELFVSDYIADQKSQNPKLKPLDQEAFQWLKDNIGPYDSIQENALYRRNNRKNKYFQEINKAWHNAVKQRLEIDPKSIYEQARKSGISNNIASMAIAVDREDTGFLKDKTYKFNVDKDSDKIFTGIQKRAFGGPIFSNKENGVDDSSALALGNQVHLAGGEHVVTADEVKALGSGDTDKGHQRMKALREKMLSENINNKIDGFMDKANQYKDKISDYEKFLLSRHKLKEIATTLDKEPFITEDILQMTSESMHDISGIPTQEAQLLLSKLDVDELANTLYSLSKVKTKDQALSIIEQLSDKKGISSILRKSTKENENKEIKYKRLGATKSEHEANYYKEKIKNSKTTVHTQSMLTGNRRQQELMIQLKNAEIQEDRKQQEKIQNILKTEFNQKSNVDKINELYDNIINRVQNSNKTLGFRQLTKSIKDYLDKFKDSEYLDYRSKDSIADQLSKILSIDSETIAYKMDWTMHKALIKLLESSIPLGDNKREVQDLYDSICSLYEAASETAYSVRQSLAKGQSHSVLQYFTLGVHKTLQKQDSISAQETVGHFHYENLKDKVALFVRSKADEASSTELYKTISVYTGMSLDKVRSLLGKIPKEKILEFLSQEDSTKKLIHLINNPGVINDYIQGKYNDTKLTIEQMLNKAKTNQQFNSAFGYLSNKIESAKDYAQPYTDIMSVEAADKINTIKNKAVNIRESISEKINIAIDNREQDNKDIDGFAGADIYISGDNSPVMTYKDIKSGFFIDKNTGKEIQAASDITGDIIDIRTGGIVVRLEDIPNLVHIKLNTTQTSNSTFIKRGLLARFVPGGIMAGKLIGNRFAAMLRGQYQASDFIADMVKLPFYAADKALRFAIDRPNDIYISDGVGGALPEPIMTKKDMKEGKYFNQDGTPIFAPSDIKGLVYDEFGDVVVDKEDFKRGLVFKNGKKVEGPWMRLLKGVSKVMFAPAIWAAKLAFKGLKAGMKASSWLMKKTGKLLFNYEVDKGSIEQTQTEVSIFSAQQLTSINEQLKAMNKNMEKQNKEDKPRAGSWKERLFPKKDKDKKDAKNTKDEKKQGGFAKAMELIREWGPAVALIGIGLMSTDFGKTLKSIGSGVADAATSLKETALWFKEKGTNIANRIDSITNYLFGGTVSDTAKATALGAGTALGAAALLSKIPASKAPSGFISSSLKTIAGVMMKMPGAKWVALAGVLYTMASISSGEDSDNPQAQSSGAIGQNANAVNTPNMVGETGQVQNTQAQKEDSSIGTYAGLAGGALLAKKGYDLYRARKDAPERTMADLYTDTPKSSSGGFISNAIDKTKSVASMALDKGKAVASTVGSKIRNATAAAALAADIKTGGMVSKVLSSTPVEYLKNKGAAMAGYASGAISGGGAMLAKAGSAIGKVANWKTALALAGGEYLADKLTDQGSITNKALTGSIGTLGSVAEGALLGSMFGPVGTALGAAAGAAYGVYSNYDKLGSAATQYRDLDTKSIRALRYAGYGFIGQSANLLHRNLQALEEIALSKITAGPTGYYIQDSAINKADVAKALGLSTSVAGLDAADKWYSYRFKPVLTAHIRAALLCKPNADKDLVLTIDNIDKEEDEVKSKYLSIMHKYMPYELPVYTINGSVVIGTHELSNSAQHRAAIDMWFKPKLNNNNRTMTVNEQLEMDKLMSNYKSRAGTRANSADYTPMYKDSSGNKVDPNAMQNDGMQGLSSHRSTGEKFSGPTVSFMQHSQDRGTTEYGVVGSADTYVGGRTLIRAKGFSSLDMAAVYANMSTQQVYNTTNRDDIARNEDAEYYDDDLNRASSPTVDFKNEKVGALFSAKGSLYSGANAMKYIVLGKNPEGIPVDVLGLQSDFRALFFGMVEEYGARTGKSVQVNSGKRDSAQQAALYRRMPDKAAPPGSSPHEYGFAVDVNTADIDAMEKLGLMRKYGLCRPLSGESWHIEPIGIQLDYHRAKKDPAYASQMIRASIGRGGSGPGDVLRAKGTKVRRLTAMLKDIWDKPPLFMSDDSVVAKVNDKYIKASDTSIRAIDNDIEKEQPKSSQRASIDPSDVKLMRYRKQDTAFANAVDASKSVVVSSSAVPTASSAVSSVNTDELSKVRVNDGNKEEIKNAIIHTSKVLGVDSNQALLIAQLESNMGQNIKATGTSAKGVFQFTDATWADAKKQYIKEHGNNAGIKGNESALDHRANILVGVNFIKNRANKGMEFDELYLRHLLGDSGYNKFKDGIAKGLQPHQAASAAAVRNNKALFFKDSEQINPKEAMNTQEFYNNLFQNKIQVAANEAGVSAMNNSTVTASSKKSYIQNNDNRNIVQTSFNRAAPRNDTNNYVGDSPVLAQTKVISEVSREKPPEVIKQATEISQTVKKEEMQEQATVSLLKKSLEVQTKTMQSNAEIAKTLSEHLALTKEIKTVMGKFGVKSPDTPNKNKEQNSDSSNKPSVMTKMPDSTVKVTHRTYEA